MKMKINASTAISGNPIEVLDKVRKHHATYNDNHPWYHVITMPDKNKMDRNNLFIFTSQTPDTRGTEISLLASLEADPESEVLAIFYMPSQSEIEFIQDYVEKINCNYSSH